MACCSWETRHPRGCGCVLAAAIVVLATGAPVVRAATPVGDITNLLRDARKLDLNEHGKTVNEMTDAIWRRNGWTSEPDRFARETVRQASRLEPWRINAKIDVVCGALATRWRLDTAQTQRLRETVIQESWVVFLQNSRAVMGIAREALATRKAGQRFTPEQIRRWSKAAQPIVEQASTAMERFAADMGKTLTPEQKRLMDRDMAANRRRAEHCVQLVEGFANGTLNPADWSVKSPKPAHHFQDRPEAQGPQDVSESAWKHYVRQFISQYRLDEPQQVAAWSIFREIQSDATTREALRRQALPDKDRAMLFAQLKRRLDALPTADQRRQANSSPTSASQPAAAN